MPGPLPLGARRALRVGFGTALGIAGGYGLGWPLPFFPALLAAVVLSVPAPPPGPKAILVLLLLLAITSFGGLLIGGVVTEVRLAGLLLLLLSIGFAGALSTKPGMAVPATFVILGTSVIGVIASQSQAAGLIMAELIVKAWFLAFAITHLAHLVFPENAGPPRPKPAPAAAPVPAGWVGVRAAVVMGPPILLALSDPGTFILLLLKGSTLAQQTAPGRLRQLAEDTVTSTLFGGALAVAIWLVLKLWPTLLIFSLLVGVAALLLARPMFGLVPSRFRYDHWQNALVTMLVILGPAVGDSAGGDDVGTEALVRLIIFMALSLYAAFAVHALDGWYLRRAARTAARAAA